MTVKQARETAQQWMLEEASRMPSFCAAYAAGSTNWLPDDAELNSASDLDIMVVLTDQGQAGKRGKFLYKDVLLEASYLLVDQFQSPEQILSDYHLAASFRTTKILCDPSARLKPLLDTVCRDYAKRRWVRQRCFSARDKILRNIRSIREQSALHDQVMACLFAAGITTHILLVAGLRNPTVRTRYVAVRELLADYGYLEFHETLLELLGSARISPERARRHVAELAAIFDSAKEQIKAPFPFASDISDAARPIAIGGSLDLIERGYHREAMFWIAVTHSRCQKILAQDAPEHLIRRFEDSYAELLADLGVPAFNAIRRRREDIEHVLPQICELAERILAAPPEVEGG